MTACREIMDRIRFTQNSGSCRLRNCLFLSLQRYGSSNPALVSGMDCAPCKNADRIWLCAAAFAIRMPG